MGDVPKSDSCSSDRPSSDDDGDNVNGGLRPIVTGVPVDPPPPPTPCNSLTSTLSTPGTTGIRRFPIPVTRENSPETSNLCQSPTPSQLDFEIPSATSTEQMHNLEESLAGKKRPASESWDRGTLKSRKSSDSSLQTSDPDNQSSNTSVIQPDGRATERNTIKLLANFFEVKYNRDATIMMYHVEIHPEKYRKDRILGKLIFNEVVARYEAVRDADAFYDGANLMFGSPKLNLGGKSFFVDVSNGQIKFSIKFLNELKCSVSNTVPGKQQSTIPREVLGGIHLLLKEKFSRGKFIPVNDIPDGENKVQILRSFQQSLKCTEQGSLLCVDYSVLPTTGLLSVIEFLKQKVERFRECLENKQFEQVRPEVKQVLEGLEVKVTHRNTSERFTIKGLSDDIMSDIKIPTKDKSMNQVKEIGLVEYFDTKYLKKIEYPHLPCLDLEPSKGRNYLPMELCEIVEMRNLKEASKLVEFSRAEPMERKMKISEWMQSEIHGGASLENFGLKVERNMTKVEGHIIGGPVLKFGNHQHVKVQTKVDEGKHKDIVTGETKAFEERPKEIHAVNGVRIEKWALLEFTCRAKEPLNQDKYIAGLKNGCKELGMDLEEPFAKYTHDVQVLSDIFRVENLLKQVKDLDTKLQIIICVMPEKKHEGYRYIKWLSETRIGLLTQCCVATVFNKGLDRFFKNLALKINAKLGGTNVELGNPLPGFTNQDSIMLIGAYVSHPQAPNKHGSSIAAVAANIDRAMVRYAARARPQNLRKEKILDFGQMVKELVATYQSENNGNKPDKIIIFRQGVSDTQIDKVTTEELQNLTMAIYDGTYRPPITLIVSMKSHRARFFIDSEDNENWDPKKNIPRGTVVDTKIMGPHQHNFYLCSHRVFCGTSKPTYYCVLHDDSKLTSKRVQELVYNLCFTHASCTHSVSLVPPLHYAHRAASRGQAFREALAEDDTQGVQSQLKDSMFFL